MQGSQALAAGGDVAERPDAALDLGQALMLTRVSTMKMLRLQLAIERRDRAVALQAVDDLVEIDGWIANGLPPDLPPSELAEAMALEVEEDRAALLSERLGLAAGFMKRAVDDPVRPWIQAEPVGRRLPEAGANDTAAEVEPRYDFIGVEEPAEEADVPERGRSRLLILAIVLVAIVAAAAIAIMVLGGPPDELAARLTALGGLT